MDAECLLEKDGTLTVVLTFDDRNYRDIAFRERLVEQGDRYILGRRFSYLKAGPGGVSESKTGLEFKVIHDS